jgi:hypothetical protein
MIAYRPPAGKWGGWFLWRVLQMKKALGSSLLFVVLIVVLIVVSGLGSLLATSARSLLSFEFIFGSIIIVAGWMGLVWLIIATFQLLSKILAAVISLVVSLVAVGIVAIPWGVVYRDYVEHREHLDIAHTVCTGHGAEQAASYAEGQRFHPTIIAEKNILGYRRWSYYNGVIPTRWRARSASDAQLVVCVDRFEDPIESCEYYTSPGEPSNWVSRSQRVLSMRLVNAKTGTTLQAIELRGSLPKECPPGRPPEAVGSPPWHVSYIGEPVPKANVIRWIGEYVEP